MYSKCKSNKFNIFGTAYFVDIFYSSSPNSLGFLILISKSSKFFCLQSMRRLCVRCLRSEQRWTNLNRGSLTLRRNTAINCEETKLGGNKCRYSSSDCTSLTSARRKRGASHTYILYLQRRGVCVCIYIAWWLVTRKLLDRRSPIVPGTDNRGTQKQNK